MYISDNPFNAEDGPKPSYHADVHQLLPTLDILDGVSEPITMIDLTYSCELRIPFMIPDLPPGYEPLITLSMVLCWIIIALNGFKF